MYSIQYIEPKYGNVLLSIYYIILTIDFLHTLKCVEIYGRNFMVWFFTKNKHLLPRQSQRTFYRNFIDILKIGHSNPCPNSKTSSYFSQGFLPFPKGNISKEKYYILLYFIILDLTT